MTVQVFPRRVTGRARQQWRLQRTKWWALRRSGEKFYGPCDAFLVSAQHKNAVAKVVLRCRADVPAVNAVWRPGTAFCRRFVQENFGAGARERRFFIVKGSIKERLVRYPGVYPRGAHKIESGGGEWNQAAPQMHWKVWVSAVETGQKVIFEYSNGLFGSIHAMDVRQDKLKSDVVVAQVFFDRIWEFFVRDVHAGV